MQVTYNFLHGLFKLLLIYKTTIMKKSIIIILLFFISTQLFSQWDLIYPHQNNYFFNDVFFFNEDSGYVVGDSSAIYGIGGGIILKTTNGGVSWNSTYTSGKLFSIYFISYDTGFAASDNSFFYKTTNAGLTWDEIIYPLPIYYFQSNNSLYFINSDVGYTCSRWSIDNNRLLKTIDGGASWNYVYYANTALYAGGGGICFPADSIGYVGVNCKTFNTGFSWVNYQDSIITQFPPNFQTSHSIDFLTSKFGMAGGYYNLGYPSYNNRGMIGITHDGGFHYLLRSVDNIRWINDIVVVDEEYAYAVGELVEMESPSMFIATNDGGDTWYYQIFEHDTIWEYPTMNAICFPSDKIGYAVSRRGQIFKTTNSGGELIPITTQNITLTLDSDDSDILFPNPASSIINIRCNNIKIKDFSIVIFNSSGQIAINGGYYFYKNNILQLDISSLPTGVYFIKILGSKQPIIHKFIKS